MMYSVIIVNILCFPLQIHLELKNLSLQTSTLLRGLKLKLLVWLLIHQEIKLLKGYSL